MKKVFGMISLFVFGMFGFTNAQSTSSIDSQINQIVETLADKISAGGDIYQQAVFSTLTKIKQKYEDNKVFADIIAKIDLNLRVKLTGTETFIVRVENVSAGSSFKTPFTPIVYAVHNEGSKPIFKAGEKAMKGLEELAEDGREANLYEWVKNNPETKASGVAAIIDGGTKHGELFPGDVYSFEMSGTYGDRFNMVSMIAQSNDLFIASDDRGIEFFDGVAQPIEGDITYMFEIWDAGTEINQAPGKGSTQAPRQGGQNIGPDENGIVREVDDEFTYPKTWQMLRITIEVKE